MERILVMNAGSSSLKCAVFERANPPRMLLRGGIFDLGIAPYLKLAQADGEIVERSLARPIGAEEACDSLLGELAGMGHLSGVSAIAHRIVHGGQAHTTPVVLDGDNIRTLESLIDAAPRHQPVNLAVVRMAQKHLPSALQIGAFDTAFHADRPKIDMLYALPRRYAEEGILAYGFHGLNYAHIARVLTKRYGSGAGGKTIVAHLGSGASLCAMSGGRSIATTMGFSALDGLMMSSRCGAIDPGVLLYLMQRKGLSPADLDRLLYEEAGLKGVSGFSGDMRTLLQSETAEAQEAVELFVYRAALETGRMIASLGRLDTLVFTGGVGENAPRIRQMLCDRLAWAGVSISPAANENHHIIISKPASRVNVLVIPANEESELAEAAIGLLPARAEAVS